MSELEVTFAEHELGDAPWYRLQVGGPCVPVSVGLHPTEVDQRRKEGRGVPSPVAADALIDTGASVTVIDESLLTALSPIITGTMPLKGVGETQPREVPVVAVQLCFPPGTIEPWRAYAAVAAIRGKTNRQRILLGRDFLVRRRFTYDGTEGRILVSERSES